MNSSELLASLSGRRALVDTCSVIGYNTSSSSSYKRVDPALFTSRASHGLAGMLNQGATCYLNSLIQSLFMIPEFRSAVYEEEKRENAEIVEELRKLFARLQGSVRGACTSKALTDSFGWSSDQMFVQHDVVELCTVLFEALERKSDPAGKIMDFIANKVSGIYTDYVQCLNCKNMRKRKDRFTSISLPIKDMRTLDNSFLEYSKPEELDGVYCPNCDSKHKSLKGIYLSYAPEILFLQLNRFEFDYEMMDKVKLKDGIDFPEILDLSEHIKKEEGDTNSTLNTYELYSVMIHTGTAFAGHYFAYIRNFKDDKWYKFDDVHVTELTAQEFNQLFHLKPASTETVSLELKAVSSEDLSSLAAIPAPPKAPEVSKAHVPSVKSAPSLSNKGISSNISGQFNVRENAYMLIYRRKSSNPTERLVINVPLQLKEDIALEDEKYLLEQAEFERRKNLIRFRVLFDDTFHNVEVSKANTIEGATLEIYNQLNISASGLPIDCVRLRQLDALRNIPGRPLIQKDASELVSSLNFPDGKNLLLETKKIGEEFTEYESDLLQIIIVELDRSSMLYKDAITVAVSSRGSVKDLRIAVGNRLKVSPSKIRMVYFTEDSAISLTSEQELLVDSLKISKGDSVYVETCEIHFSEGDSLIMQKYHDAVNLIP